MWDDRATACSWLYWKAQIFFMQGVSPISCLPAYISASAASRQLSTHRQTGLLKYIDTCRVAMSSKTI